MKIIKEGTPRAERDWRGTCYYCKSIIEAKEGELKTHDSQLDGEYSEPVACLVCGKPMHFYPVKP